MNEKKDQNFEWAAVFDNIITKGHVEIEEEVIPGLIVKLRPLNSNEQLAAESVSIANNPMVPIDTIEKIRAINILSRAIIEVNKIPVKEDDESRKELYDKLLKLPGHVIDKINSLYLKALKEEKKLYEGDLGEKVENF